MEEWKAHDRTITSLHWSPHQETPKCILSSSLDSWIRLWDVRTNDLGGSVSLQSSLGLWDSGVYSVKWNVTSGNQLISMQMNHLAVWDIRSLAVPQYLYSSNAQMVDFDWSQRYPNRVVICTDDGSVRIWNMNNENDTILLDSNRTGVSSVLFSQTDDNILLNESWTAERRTTVIDGQNGRELSTIKQHGSTIKWIQKDKLLAITDDLRLATFHYSESRLLQLSKVSKGSDSETFEKQFKGFQISHKVKYLDYNK